MSISVSKVWEHIKMLRENNRENEINYCEIVRDFDGTYYANLTWHGNYIPLKENVSYRELRKECKEKGYDILPNLSKLIFEQYGRKGYAHIQGMIKADTMVCDKSEHWLR